MERYAGFIERHTRCENNKFKIFKKFQGSYYTSLELFKVYAKIIERSNILFNFKYLLQSYVVANFKSFKCLTFNNNLYEPPVKNLLNPFRRERLLYFRVLTLLCFRCLHPALFLYSLSFFFF